MRTPLDNKQTLSTHKKPTKSATHPKQLLTIGGLLLGLSVTVLCVLVYLTSVSPNPAAQIDLGPPDFTDDASSLIVPTPDNFNDNIADLLDETNRARTENNIGTLAMNPKLNISANNKCEDMVNRNYWEHNDPEGNDPYRFITRAEVKYSKAGENLAYGFKSSKAVIEGWLKSPTHKENLLNPDYKQVGFGICESENFINQGPQTIVVQHFATPR